MVLVVCMNAMFIDFSILYMFGTVNWCISEPTLFLSHSINVSTHNFDLFWPDFFFILSDVFAPLEVGYGLASLFSS
ncbi:MAG: hypothetical protein RLZZ262_30, partial [Bacteroidota bacterium]